MPPFDGPRAMLCVTRYPVNARTEPSSIEVGIETSTAFLHCDSTATRRSSIPNVRATFSSCSCAIRNGFSRRCDSVTAAAITLNRTLLLEPERDLRALRRCRERQRRPRRESQLVAAGRKANARRPAAGDPEAVRAGQQIAQARHEPEELPFGAVKEDVEAADRLDLETAGVDERPSLHAQDRGRRVRRREGGLADRRASDQV